jgi:hypothetical protein
MGVVVWASGFSFRVRGRDVTGLLVKACSAAESLSVLMVG